MIHPIRAALGLLIAGATVAFIVCDIKAPDAWWALLGSVATFYFIGGK